MGLIRKDYMFHHITYMEMRYATGRIQYDYTNGNSYSNFVVHIVFQVT